MERFKRASELEPGDRVSIQFGGLAKVASVKSSGQTMVCRNRAERGEQAVGLVVTYELMDGPNRGQRHYDIIHPDDRVRL